ncbi:MAG: hypothetical protein QM778_06105 [Myxococcales bacterium]
MVNIVTGWNFFCAQTASKRLACKAPHLPEEAPVLVAGFEHSVQLACTAASVCGLEADGSVQCHGVASNAATELSVRPGALWRSANATRLCGGYPDGSLDCVQR